MEKTGRMVVAVLAILATLNGIVAGAPDGNAPTTLTVDFSVSTVAVSDAAPEEGDPVVISATVALDAPSPDGAWVKDGIAMECDPFPSGVSYPVVLKIGSGYRMWYGGYTAPTSGDIYCSDSADGMAWTNRRLAVPRPAGTYYAAGQTVVVDAQGDYRMYFSAKQLDGSVDIYLATSSNAETWTTAGVVLAAGPEPYDSLYASHPCVLFDGQGYTMFYKGYTSSKYASFCRATSSDGVAWTKRGVVMPMQSFLNIECPAVARLDDGTYSMLFNAHVNTATGRVSRIYSSASQDGIAWSAAQLALDNTPGGYDSISMCAPFVLDDDAAGISRMYYGAYTSDQRWRIATADWAVPSVTSTCVARFYVDWIAAENLVSETCVTLDASCSAVVASSPWTAAAGTHEIIVAVSPVSDAECDPSDDVASLTVDVAVKSQPTPASLAITKVKTSGIDNGVTLTYYEWDLLVTIVNDGGSLAEGVVVKDVIPAELELLSFNASKGDVATGKPVYRLPSPVLGLTTKGVLALEMPAVDGTSIGVRDTRSTLSPPSPSAAPLPPTLLPVRSTHVCWTIGDLAPGESATLLLHICTRVNPGGNQEFTSPGTYSLNDGASATGFDTLTAQPIEAGPTPPITVAIVGV